MDSKTIEQLIRAGIADVEVKVQSDDNVHFEAVVSSSAFLGKNPLQRHRMVYATLGDLLGGEIHALSIQANLPDTPQDNAG
ncbi:MAG: BolA/IbaG family iron-sulfur metabolism protein [Xanthomonadales bacterium]|nr:BolA/IbaG family iron-sulfur metabolism protein [Xanthomonadales bacterium]